MKNVRVFATRRNNNPFSWAVRKATGKEYSHVAVSIDGLTYEAVLGGCRVLTDKAFLERNHLVHSMPVWPSPEEKQQMGMRAQAKLGKAYDIPALFWFLIFLTARRMGLKVPALRINPRWLICSEYAYYILTGRNETVTPEDVLQHTLSQP